MRWFWLTLVVLLGVTATAFTLQNNAFTAQLQLDLWFAAWRFQHPVGVPVLMWASFGVGVVLTALFFWIRGMASARRIAELEQQVAIGATKAKDPWGG